MSKISEKWIKNGFHYLENLFSLTGMQDLFKKFKYTFPLNEKIKLAVAGVSENGRKKLSPLARKPVSTNRNAGLV